MESSIDLWAKTDLKEAAAAYADVIAYRDGSIESLHEKLLEVIRTRIGPSNYNERHTLMLNAMLPLKIYK